MKRFALTMFILLLGIGLLVSCANVKEDINRDKPSTETVAKNQTTVTELPDIKPFDKTYTKSELEEDFNALRSTIERSHPRLYADRAALEILFDNQFRLIKEGMTELEFLRVVTPIVSKLNCGHTCIILSNDYLAQLATEGKYFPLPLRFIGNHAYIIQNGFCETIPVGSELLSINGQSVKDMIIQLFANVASDGLNETYKTMGLNRWFKNRYKNYIDQKDTYEITYKTELSDQILTATLEGVNNEMYNSKNTPVYIDSKIPYSSSFKDDYAILTMCTFYPEGEYSLSDYRAYIDDFFYQVKEKDIENVILDVRDNAGGDPYVTSHLFSYLAKTSQPYFASSAANYYTGLKDNVPLSENHFDGELYILMNGGSFSSTGHLLALLKYQNIGTFIGEESGGSFACTDSTKSMTLPHTKIQYLGSTQVWEVAAKGLTPGRGIMPDYEVTQTIHDYLDKKDSILAFAIDLIEKNNQTQ